MVSGWASVIHHGAIVAVVLVATNIVERAINNVRAMIDVVGVIGGRVG
jgi:hypothetical protein